MYLLETFFDDAYHHFLSDRDEERCSSHAWGKNKRARDVLFSLLSSDYGEGLIDTSITTITEQKGG